MTHVTLFGVSDSVVFIVICMGEDGMGMFHWACFSSQ